MILGYGDLEACVAANQDAEDPRGLCRYLMEQERSGWPAYRRGARRLSLRSGASHMESMPVSARDEWGRIHRMASRLVGEEVAPEVADRIIRLGWTSDGGRTRRSPRGVLWKVDRLIRTWPVWAGSREGCQATLDKVGRVNVAGMCEWLSGEAPWHVPSDKEVDAALIAAMAESISAERSGSVRKSVSERGRSPEDVLPVAIRKAAWESGDWIFVEVGRGFGDGEDPASSPREREVVPGDVYELVTPNPTCPSDTVVGFKFKRGTPSEWTIPRAIVWANERATIVKSLSGDPAGKPPGDWVVGALRSLRSPVTVDGIFDAVAAREGWLGDVRKARALEFWSNLDGALKETAVRLEAGWARPAVAEKSSRRDGRWVCEGNVCRWERFAPFRKLTYRHQVAIGEVYVPWVVDKQGDWMNPDEIEDMAYRWMENWQILGKNHVYVGDRSRWCVVESYFSKPGDPDFEIPRSWIVGMKFKNQDDWQEVLHKRLTGFSIAGDGIRQARRLPDQYRN